MCGCPRSVVVHEEFISDSNRGVCQAVQRVAELPVVNQRIPFYDFAYIQKIAGYNIELLSVRFVLFFPHMVYQSEFVE